MATLIGEAASHVTTRAHRRLLVTGFYAGAQFAGFGPLPARYNDEVAGVACGMLFGGTLIWSRTRRPQE